MNKLMKERQTEKTDSSQKDKSRNESIITTPRELWMWDHKSKLFRTISMKLKHKNNKNFDKIDSFREVDLISSRVSYREETYSSFYFYFCFDRLLKKKERRNYERIRQMKRKKKERKKERRRNNKTNRQMNRNLRCLRKTNLQRRIKVRETKRKK